MVAYRVCTKLRPKDVIGRDEDVVLKIVQRTVRRILIGQDEDVVLKIVRRSVRKIMIGRDEDVVLKIVRRSVRRILIGRDEATCLYDDASDCRPARLILLDEKGKLSYLLDASGWTVQWTCLAETLLIG